VGGWVVGRGDESEAHTNISPFYEKLWRCVVSAAEEECFQIVIGSVVIRRLASLEIQK
jgi:hypothetical protein